MCSGMGTELDCPHSVVCNVAGTWRRLLYYNSGMDKKNLPASASFCFFCWLIIIYSQKMGIKNLILLLKGILLGRFSIAII
jgi:hypothetical protein